MVDRYGENPTAKCENLLLIISNNAFAELVIIGNIMRIALSLSPVMTGLEQAHFANDFIFFFYVTNLCYLNI